MRLSYAVYVDNEFVSEGFAAGPPAVGDFLDTPSGRVRIWRRTWINSEGADTERETDLDCVVLNARWEEGAAT